MSHVAIRTSKLLLVAAFVSAIFETHWMISAALFAVGFIGCLFFGFVQPSVDDDRYEAAVMAHRLAEDSFGVKIPSSGAMISLVALVAFGVCAFLSIRMNKPLPAGSGFVIAVVGGLVWPGTVG
jgi:hypothetical protein